MSERVAKIRKWNHNELRLTFHGSDTGRILTHDEARTLAHQLLEYVSDDDVERWIVGQPGGPAGSFYSVIKPSGNIVALQVPDEETARLIAGIPVLLANKSE